MPRYIALLRAINVGGHTVKMDHLRGLFEAMKFANVETFIASGNVIFDSKSQDTKSLEQRIASHLEKSLGYQVVTFLRTTSELSDIAGYKPFAESDLTAEGNILYVAFAANPASAEGKKNVLALRTKAHDFHLYRREVYWLRRRLLDDSDYSGAVLEKRLGMPITVRNITTVRKMAVRYP